MAPPAQGFMAPPAQGDTNVPLRIPSWQGLPPLEPAFVLSFSCALSVLLYLAGDFDIVLDAI